jgi:hypothetical protein
MPESKFGGTYRAVELDAPVVSDPEENFGRLIVDFADENRMTIYPNHDAPRAGLARSPKNHEYPR